MHLSIKSQIYPKMTTQTILLTRKNRKFVINYLVSSKMSRFQQVLTSLMMNLSMWSILIVGLKWVLILFLRQWINQKFKWLKNTTTLPLPALNSIMFLKESLADHKALKLMLELQVLLRMILIRKKKRVRIRKKLTLQPKLSHLLTQISKISEKIFRILTFPES